MTSVIYLALRSVFEQTHFRVSFVGHDEANKVVVTGRNLEKICTPMIQALMELLLRSKHHSSEDRVEIITKTEVIPVVARVE